MLYLGVQLDPLIRNQVTISNPCRECFVSTLRDFLEVSDFRSNEGGGSVYPAAKNGSIIPGFG